MTTTSNFSTYLKVKMSILKKDLSEVKKNFLIFKPHLNVPYDANYFISYTIENGNLDILRYFHEDEKFAINNDAVLTCCTYGKLEILQYIISKGIDCNFNDYEPLKTAITYHKTDMIKYLVSECHQDVNVVLSFDKDNIDTETLEWAKEYKKILSSYKALDSNLQKDINSNSTKLKI